MSSTLSPKCPQWRFWHEEVSKLFSTQHAFTGQSCVCSTKWQQQIILHSSYPQLWPPPGWSIRRGLRERCWCWWRGWSWGVSKWNRKRRILGEEASEIHVEETGKQRKKEAKEAEQAGLSLAISQPRVSGSQTWRTSKLSLTTVQRGGRREGETHTAETQVIPQLKGPWV